MASSSTQHHGATDVMSPMVGTIHQVKAAGSLFFEPQKPIWANNTSGTRLEGPDEIRNAGSSNAIWDPSHGHPSDESSDDSSRGTDQSLVMFHHDLNTKEEYHEFMDMKKSWYIHHNYEMGETTTYEKLILLELLEEEKAQRRRKAIRKDEEKRQKVTKT